MPRRLARFAVVGSATTAVDVGLFAVPVAPRAPIRRRRRRPGARRRRRGVVGLAPGRHLPRRPVPPVAGAARGVRGVGRRRRRRRRRRHRCARAASPASGRTRAGLAAKLPAVAVAGTVRLGAAPADALPHRPRGPRRPTPTGRRRRASSACRSSSPPTGGRSHRRAGPTHPGRRWPRVDGGVEIVVVDDGSADAHRRTRPRPAGADVVVVQPRNRGKGAAVRAGVLAASRAHRRLHRRRPRLRPRPARSGCSSRSRPGWDVVVGSRRHDQTTTLVRAGRLREIGGRRHQLVHPRRCCSAPTATPSAG